MVPRNKPWALLALTFGLTLVAACDRAEVDYLFVTIVDGSGGALSVPQDLDAFEVRVASATSTDEEDDLVRFRRTVVLESVAESLPQSLSITRAPDGTGTVRVTVLGLRNGRVVQRIERVASFGIGRVDVPEFALTPLCFNRVCPVGESCDADGTCRDLSTPEEAGVPPADAGPCGPLLVQCTDECVPFSDDNCETCSNACAADERCVSNRCVCDVGTIACGERCADLSTSLTDCGACDTPCAAPNATPICDGGTCRVAACDAGWADCDTDPINGCETPLGTRMNCTACSDFCLYPYGEVECQPTGCVTGGCLIGRANCDGSDENGCETRLGTIANCGRCRQTCSVSGGTAGCTGGTCVIASCNGGRGNCNGTYSDGCETTLTSLSNCGSCGSSCSLARASESCASGACEITACNTGWANCDGIASNGCETNTDFSESDCGTCGNSCDTNERCTGGVCACPNNGNWEDLRGPCLPSCGHLLRMTSNPRGGTSCCTSGCATSRVGGFQATHDCNHCCAADVGVNGCTPF